MGIIAGMRMDSNSKRTLPVCARGRIGRIVYANRKYHSGLDVGGVFKGWLGHNCSGRLGGPENSVNAYMREGRGVSRGVF